MSDSRRMTATNGSQNQNNQCCTQHRSMSLNARNIYWSLLVWKDAIQLITSAETRLMQILVADLGKVGDKLTSVIGIRSRSLPQKIVSKKVACNRNIAIRKPYSRIIIHCHEKPSRSRKPVSYCTCFLAPWSRPFIFTLSWHCQRLWVRLLSCNVPSKNAPCLTLKLAL